MIQRGVMAGVVVVLFSSCEPKPATCEPNPCTTDRQTTCEVEDGTAVCRCDPGYAPEGEGCSELPAWTCERQHPAGDFAEPDECPPLAHPLAAELPEAHTIEPAGDHDWYEVRVTAGRIVQFSAVSSSTPLLLEVFDERGLTLLASDARGVRDASVSFLAPRTAAVMIRVRALRGDAVGPYDASWRELGSDDFVNTPDEAITLTPAAGQFSGQIQYAGDIDVVRLEVPPLTAVWLSNRDAGGGHEIEIAQVDGGFRTIQTLESTLVTVPETESFVLRARALDGRRLGPFVLAM
ncbi:MAG TPA: PPC domain-containing protein, partial [Archangium sp.]